MRSATSWGPWRSRSRTAYGAAMAERTSHPSEMPRGLRYSGRTLSAVVAVAMFAAVGETVDSAEVTTLWQKSLVGDIGRNAQIRDIAVAPDGGYCMAGSVRNPIEGTGDWEADAWIVRLDAAGGVVWDRTYGGDDDEWGETVAATEDGGCIVGARIGRDVSRAWIIRLDGGGRPAWERFIGESNSWSPDAIEPAVDGGFVVLGIMSDPEDHFGERVPYWIALMSGHGELTWLLRAEDSEILYRRPGPHDLELFRASPLIAVAASGGARLSGPMKLPGASFGYSIAELDGAGALVSSSTLDTNGHPDAFAAQPGLGYAVAFFEQGPGSSSRVRLKMFDTKGIERWRVQTALSAGAPVQSVYTVRNARLVLFPDGGMTLVVERRFPYRRPGTPNSINDLWLVRFDPTGHPRSHVSLARQADVGDGMQSLLAIARLGDSVIVAGRTDWPAASERMARAALWLRRVKLP